MKADAPPRKYLVVDDDSIFRERLVKAIIARGFEAHGAGSGEDAIEIARRTQARGAIIDLRMPGMSGLDLVRELMSRHPGMQIVVLTGYGSIATALEAVRRGAKDYLQKPLDTDQILAAFEKDPDEAVATAETTPSLARVEWEHIQRVLTDCEGNISLAARKLGLHRRSLQRKLGKFPPLE